PYPPRTVRPSRRISPSLGHRSCGKAFSWSTFSASGAISASANRRTASRRESISSPSGKGRIANPLCIVIPAHAGIRTFVIPAYAGIHGLPGAPVDPRFRGDDGASGGGNNDGALSPVVGLHHYGSGAAADAALEAR